MNQLADSTLVNEVSRSLFPYPVKPTPTRARVRRRPHGVVCAGSTPAASAELAPKAEQGSDAIFADKRLALAFWLTIAVGFAVIVWQLVLEFQAPPTPPVLLPWAR
ncbi:MAG: hypothetical protein LBC29_01645 [Propionibacteriaceae bacterium]|jgi:hypothetical protein|nr:hypothetical protein [Propionibacteriaceae bacterium]